MLATAGKRLATAALAVAVAGFMAMNLFALVALYTSKMGALGLN